MRKTTNNPLFTPGETEITPYDTADYLDSDETIAQYLAVSLEDPDPDIFLKALEEFIDKKLDVQ